ncbi:MAG: CAP domain-containing protein [Planctomycetota bacterium]
MLNGWRQQLGHPVLALRPELSRACEEHALYCATNQELVHVQDPKKPAASSKGAKAGQLSEVAWAQSMERGLRIWVHTFFHRLGMLSPGLEHVGMGHLYGVAVLDTGSGMSARAGAIWHWPLAGAIDVPPAWETGEFPSPLGDVDFTNAVAAGWGYPISVTFPTAAVTAVVAKVTCRGAELPILVTSPENPSHRNHPDNLCSILVMTRAPLPGGGEIQVDVTCQYAGKPFARQWRFTTRVR